MSVTMQPTANEWVPGHGNEVCDWSRKENGEVREREHCDAALNKNLNRLFAESV